MTALQQNIQKAEDEKSQARLDYEAGLEFMSKGEMAQAANMFHNALVGFEQDKDINGIANATDKLGDICSERKDLSSALTHYDKVISICQDQGDSFSVFAVDKKKARLFAACGKFDDAITMYLDIVDEYNAMRNPQGTVDTLETLAEVYIAAGNRDRAADCYRTAARIHEKYKHTRHAATLLQKAEETLKVA